MTVNGWFWRHWKRKTATKLYILISLDIAYRFYIRPSIFLPMICVLDIRQTKPFEINKKIFLLSYFLTLYHGFWKWDFSWFLIIFLRICCSYRICLHLEGLQEEWFIFNPLSLGIEAIPNVSIACWIHLKVCFVRGEFLCKLWFSTVPLSMLSMYVLRFGASSAKNFEVLHKWRSICVAV